MLCHLGTQDKPDPGWQKIELALMRSGQERLGRSTEVSCGHTVGSTELSSDGNVPIRRGKSHKWEDTVNQRATVSVFHLPIRTSGPKKIKCTKQMCFRHTKVMDRLKISLKKTFFTFVLDKLWI